MSDISIEWSEKIRPLKYTGIFKHVIEFHKDTATNMLQILMDNIYCYNASSKQVLKRLFCIDSIIRNSFTFYVCFLTNNCTNTSIITLVTSFIWLLAKIHSFLSTFTDKI